MGRPMRLELTRVGLLVQLANRYTTRGALSTYAVARHQQADCNGKKLTILVVEGNVPHRTICTHELVVKRSQKEGPFRRVFTIKN